MVLRLHNFQRLLSLNASKHIKYRSYCVVHNPWKEPVPKPERVKVGNGSEHKILFYRPHAFSFHDRAQFVRFAKPPTNLARYNFAPFNSLIFIYTWAQKYFIFYKQKYCLKMKYFRNHFCQGIVVVDQFAPGYQFRPTPIFLKIL